MRQLTKVSVALGVALLLVAALAALPAQAAFGLNNVSTTFTSKDGSVVTQAGSHPFAVTTSLEVNTRFDPLVGEEIPDGDVRTLRFQFPAGFIGSRTAVPRCSTADFLTIDEFSYPACPDSTAIGATRVRILHPGGIGGAVPVYNLVPPPGVAAKIGFVATGVPVTAEIGLKGEDPYNLTAGLFNIPQAVRFYGGTLQIWGVPADESHDPFRGRCLAHDGGTVDEFASKGICKSGASSAAFITLPRSCTGPLVSSYEAVSWQYGDAVPDSGVFETPGMTGCSKLGFSPQVQSKPTTSSAESASGLDISVDFHDEGFANPTGIGQSEIKKSVVALPAGMTVNPSSAAGLSVCNRAEYAAETLTSQPGQGCPQASKVGEVEVESPASAGEVFRGSVFLASQDDNPFGTLIALYVVIKNPELGALVKLPLKVEPNEERGPNAGRLVATLDNIPQIPVSRFNFHFKEGARAPLVTPPICGTYATEASFTPWANPDTTLATTATFKVNSGVGGGPCPAGGVPPFHPGFVAGATNNSAGSYSPFYLRLTRQDGEQDMTRFSTVLPPGVLGRIAGVAKCSDAAIAAARGKSGRQELADPSCSQGSQIGHVLGGAGVGGTLTYVPGKLYLAGPFGGDPLSVVAIVPAVAGPFDVGNVVARLALTLNPDTAVVEVDGAQSEPLPHILKGIPLKVRDVRAYVDRPNFTLNATSCAKEQARAVLFGGFLDVFSSADDIQVGLSDRYQAASCASLKFKPGLTLALSGGTKRNDHPALKSVVTYPRGPGYSNIRKAVVTLPHSMFLDQSHIRTVCTRVQFAAKNCPKGSIYGRVRATSPLLDEPLTGPVYLRSSSHPLPDLVFALHGLVDLNVVTRIDSVDGRIRASLDAVPDAPVSKFTLEMQGGKKGLIVNSRNLCAHGSRAMVDLTAQSGRTQQTQPLIKPGCGKGKGKSSGPKAGRG